MSTSRKRIAEYQKLDYDYRINNRLVRKTLAKRLVCNTNFITFVFVFSEYKSRTGEWGQPKIRIQKYIKRLNTYREHSGITVSSCLMADDLSKALAELLQMIPCTTSPPK